MLEKSLSYERLGADGLLLITPYYNKTNEEGMYLHFKTVADAVKIPCILYNVPGRTGCSISVANVARLSQHPNIVGIKEASGNMSYAAKVAKYLSDDFAMYSGNDDMIVASFRCWPTSLRRRRIRWFSIILKAARTTHDARRLNFSM